MAEKMYLADQETQDSIKELIEALSSTVAKEATLAATDAVVDAIKTVVDTLTTNLATVDGIVDTINANVSAVKTATAASTTAAIGGTLSQKLEYIIDTLLGTVNASGGTASAGSIMAKLNKLLTAGTIPVVRKIQRGNLSKTSSDGTYNFANVTLSGFTNASKMIAIVNGHGEISDSLQSVLVYDLTTSILSVGTRTTSLGLEGRFSYQVIEFY